jgi:hypothetical protein
MALKLKKRENRYSLIYYVTTGSQREYVLNALNHANCGAILYNYVITSTRAG